MVVSGLLTVRVQILTLPFINYMILGTSLNLTKIQCPYVKDGDNKARSLLGYPAD